MASNNNLDFEKELKELTPLIRKISANFISPQITADELFQEGVLGVFEAYKKFDSEKGTKFSTYAYFWIKKYIMDYVGAGKKEEKFNDILYQDKIIKNQPENLSEEKIISFPEKMPKKEKIVLDLLFNEKKTLKEISEILKISREKVRQIKEMGLRRMRIKSVSN